MAAFVQVLSFRSMISPVLLQIPFWAGTGGILYGTCTLISLERRA